MSFTGTYLLAVQGPVTPMMASLFISELFQPFCSTCCDWCNCGFADARTSVYPRLSATLNRRSPSPDPSPRRSLFTRSGSMRRQDCPSPTETTDKPAGKRKFKSKHLIADAEDQKKVSALQRQYIARLNFGIWSCQSETSMLGVL